MRDFSSSSANIDRTRLKDRILSKLPDLKAYRRGEETVLVFETDIGQVMITACQYTDGMYMYLAKAAEIIRKELSQHKIRFSDSFDEVLVSTTVSNSSNPKFKTE